MHLIEIVARSTALSPGALAAAELDCETEINNFHMSFRIEQNVLGFEIAVDNT